MIDDLKYKIYALTDSFGIRYIGITSKTLKERLQQHFSTKRHHNPYKFNWIKKHKEEINIILLIDNLTQKEAFEKEIELIAEYRNKGVKLVNSSSGGDKGSLGVKWSLESREKLSKYKKGKKLSEEHKKKIINGTKGINTGPISKERKKILSIAHTGYKHTEEAKKNMSKKRTEEHRKNMSEAAKKAWEKRKEQKNDRGQG